MVYGDIDYWLKHRIVRDTIDFLAFPATKPSKPKLDIDIDVDVDVKV